MSWINSEYTSLGLKTIVHHLILFIHLFRLLRSLLLNPKPQRPTTCHQVTLYRIPHPQKFQVPQTCFKHSQVVQMTQLSPHREVICSMQSQREPFQLKMSLMRLLLPHNRNLSWRKWPLLLLRSLLLSSPLNPSSQFQRITRWMVWFARPCLQVQRQY